MDQYMSSAISWIRVNPFSVFFFFKAPRSLSQQSPILEIAINAPISGGRIRIFLSSMIYTLYNGKTPTAISKKSLLAFMMPYARSLIRESAISLCFVVIVSNGSMFALSK